MYINPFWAGVFATIFAEILVLFILAVIAAIRRVRHD
jgi:hypothetical protein